MKLTKEHSELINSPEFCQIRTRMDDIRQALRLYCEHHQFIGELLNAYNKTFIFTDEMLYRYLSGLSGESKNFPKKHLIEFFKTI